MQVCRFKNASEEKIQRGAVFGQQESFSRLPQPPSWLQGTTEVFSRSFDLLAAQSSASPNTGELNPGAEWEESVLSFLLWEFESVAQCVVFLLWLFVFTENSHFCCVLVLFQFS